MTGMVNRAYPLVRATKLTGLFLVIAGMWIGLDAAGRSYRVFSLFTWGYQWQATVSAKHPYDCPGGGDPWGRSSPLPWTGARARSEPAASISGNAADAGAR